MLRRYFILIIIIGFTYSTFSQNQRQDDSVIYIAIIKSIIPTSTKSVLIINETVKYEHTIDSASIIDSNSVDPNEILTRKYEWENSTKTPFDSIAYRPMVRYYLGKHKKNKIAYRFPLPFKIIYLSGEEYQIGKETDEYWSKLDRTYSNAGGVLSFSEIFYSTDGSRAVVFYSIRRKDGKGSVLLFQKVNGNWEMKFESNVWHN